MRLAAIALFALWLGGCWASRKLGRDTDPQPSEVEEVREGPTTEREVMAYLQAKLLSNSRQKDAEEELRTGKPFNNHGDDVRIDATSPETLRDSWGKIMDGWGEAKTMEFLQALGRFRDLNAKIGIYDSHVICEGLHGMTANEIIAKAAEITDEDIASARPPEAESR